MTTRAMTLILMTTLMVALVGCERTEPTAEKSISGRIEQGLRILTIEPEARDQAFRIYRGDYVIPQLANAATFHLAIPGLSVDRSFPAPAGERPYFKAHLAGLFAFEAGEATGIIEVIDYRAASFRDLTATESAAFIAQKKPLVLDVRTEHEFSRGHLDGAVLLPIQEMQKRIGELSRYKDRPIFVYCRTGNRSTVASKLLVDAGHREVVHLRGGIVDWERQGLKVVRPKS